MTTNKENTMTVPIMVGRLVLRCRRCGIPRYSSLGELDAA